jgi:hypothetical protein
MHNQSIDSFRHEHLFLGEDHARNERKTWTVIVLCGVMMMAEIGGGVLFGSMALMADGLHMSTHAGALLIAALAYTSARRHASDDRFVFGPGKLGDLAAFTSAIILALIALVIGWESIGGYTWQRFHREVGCSHPRLDRSEWMLDRLATLAHSFQALIEAALDGFEHMLVLPTRDPPLLAGVQLRLRAH